MEISKKNQNNIYKSSAFTRYDAYKEGYFCLIKFFIISNSILFLVMTPLIYKNYSSARPNSNFLYNTDPDMIEKSSLLNLESFKVTKKFF